MSQSYTVVQKLVESGIPLQGIQSFLTIMKNDALREFAMENYDIFQAEDCEGLLVDRLNKEFNMAGYSLAAGGAKDEYLGDLYDEDFDDLTYGERSAGYDLLSAFGSPSQNKYEGDWLDGVEFDKVTGCVREISQVDHDWGVFIQPEVTNWTNREYVKHVHAYADEKLVHTDCSLDEVKMMTGFESEVPNIVCGLSVSYVKQEFPHGEPGDGYCYVEKTKQLEDAKASGFNMFATKKRGKNMMHLAFSKCVVKGDFYLYDRKDAKYVDEEDYEVKCDEKRDQGLPETLKKIYAVLKAPPGRAYYLHKKMRGRTIKHLKDIGYLNQGVAKKPEKVQADVPPPAPSNVPQNPGNVGRDEWIKQFADLGRRKVQTQVLTSIFGMEVYKLSLKNGSGKNTISKRIGRELNPGAMRLDRLIYMFVQGFRDENCCSEKQAREAVFMIMGTSFGSYDFIQVEGHEMVRKHLVQ